MFVLSANFEWRPVCGNSFPRKLKGVRYFIYRWKFSNSSIDLENEKKGNFPETDAANVGAGHVKKIRSIVSGTISFTRIYFYTRVRKYAE